MREFLEIVFRKGIIKRNNKIIKRIIEKNKEEEKNVEILKKEVSKLLIDIMKTEEAKW